MQSYRLSFWSRWRQENGDPTASIANGSGHAFRESYGPRVAVHVTNAGVDEAQARGTLAAFVPEPKLGYSIVKTAEMLQSGLIRDLRDVRGGRCPAGRSPAGGLRGSGHCAFIRTCSSSAWIIFARGKPGGSSL